MNLFVTGALLLTATCQQTGGGTLENLVGCSYHNSYLNLRCHNTQRIYIENSTYGNSAEECWNVSECCPAPSDCKVDVDADVIRTLREKCDGKLECKIRVSGDLCNGVLTDYESVNYICSTKPPKNVTGCGYNNNGSFGLHCAENQYIHIVKSALRISMKSCRNRKKSCCPVQRVCTVATTTQRLQELKSSCNGKKDCHLTMAKGECSWKNRKHRSKQGKTHFETVSYVCINNLPTAKRGSWRGKSSDTGTDSSAQSKTALIAGLTVAACAVVALIAVLVIVVYRRKRSAARRPALDGHQSTQLDMNLYRTTGPSQITHSGQSEPDTNVCETAPEDTATHPSNNTRVYYNGQTLTPSDDNHVYYNNGQSVALPGEERVYYNEQSAAKGARRKPENNIQASPDVPRDEYYSKTKKQNKDDSEDYNYVWTAGESGETGGSEGAGGSGRAGKEGTHLGNQDLEYVDIDHSITSDQRSAGITPRSPQVAYTEVQRKKDADTDQQDRTETPSGNNMQMVENELYT